MNIGASLLDQCTDALQSVILLYYAVEHVDSNTTDIVAFNTTMSMMLYQSNQLVQTVHTVLQTYFNHPSTINYPEAAILRQMACLNDIIQTKINSMLQDTKAQMENNK